MLKLSRHLYGWDPDPRYFDYYERVLLNHRIGTIRPHVGTTQYYLSLTPGVWKTFNTEDQTFWCCTGSGLEEFAKLNDSIYWRDRDGVYVNLFVPSELEWPEKHFTLRQETRFPESENTVLTVIQSSPGEIAIRVRVPGWLRSAPVVTVNGKVLDASAAPGSYLTLSRAWRPHDRIEMRLPMHLRVEAMPDDPRMQAFLYGPLVLAGDLGDEGPDRSAHLRPESPCRRSRRRTTRLAAWSGQPDAADPGHRHSDVPSSWRRPRVVDCAGGCAAGLPHYRTEDECHLPAVESAI